MTNASSVGKRLDLVTSVLVPAVGQLRLSSTRAAGATPPSRSATARSAQTRSPSARIDAASSAVNRPTATAAASSSSSFHCGSPVSPGTQMSRTWSLRRDRAPVEHVRILQVDVPAEERSARRSERPRASARDPSGRAGSPRSSARDAGRRRAGAPTARRGGRRGARDRPRAPACETIVPSGMNVTMQLRRVLDHAQRVALVEPPVDRAVAEGDELAASPHGPSPPAAARRPSCRPTSARPRRAARRRGVPRRARPQPARA